MKSFTVEEITQIVDGMLTKAQSPEITRIAPPLLCEEDTLALALGEEEISNLSKSKAKEADYSYLQVIETNEVALNLYKKFGYEKLYTYWYMVKK